MPFTLYSILIYPKLGYIYAISHFIYCNCSHRKLNEKGASINMDDEMKEPDEKQALSASDESKPNMEAEQFSDGADDAPSPEDRPSNEDEIACKKEESSSPLARAIHKFSGKKRAAISAAAVVVAIICLPMLFPQLFCTHKLWANATCTSPRTCKSCGKTEGDRSGTNGKKQPVRLRRPVNVVAEQKGSPLGINRVHGPRKSTT